MEAMSFGIPCIATDVGGTKEVVENYKNGILLSSDFKPCDLARWIMVFKKWMKQNISGIEIMRD